MARCLSACARLCTLMRKRVYIYTNWHAYNWVCTRGSTCKAHADTSSHLYGCWSRQSHHTDIAAAALCGCPWRRASSLRAAAVLRRDEAPLSLARAPSNEPAPTPECMCMRAGVRALEPLCVHVHAYVRGCLHA